MWCLRMLCTLKANSFAEFFSTLHDNIFGMQMKYEILFAPPTNQVSNEMQITGPNSKISTTGSPCLRAPQSGSF